MLYFSEHSNEVRHSGAWWDDTFRVRNCFEDLEVSVQLIVQGQNGCNVTTTVAVVWRRPHGHQVVLGEHVLEALLHKLMGTANQLQIIDLAKLRGDLGAKQPASTTGANLPSFNFFRVRPHEVAEGTLVGNFLVPRNGPDLIKGSNVRR